MIICQGGMKGEETVGEREKEANPWAIRKWGLKVVEQIRQTILVACM
jgi:hypothetical protein